jgi:hypothetical protein
MAALGGLLLAVLLSACGSSSTTPQPRATINFLIRNNTTKCASYRFTGSATVLPSTGPIDSLWDTRLGATWDPTWTLEINAKKAVASSDASDLQLGTDTGASLTVIIVIDASGVRTTDVHPGPPNAGEVASPDPSATPPRCDS